MQDSPAKFTGKVAIVTGSSRGIGQSIAIALARHGATMCLVGRRRETLEQTAREMAGAVRAHIVETDLVRDHQVGQLCEFVREHLGRADILVHSAGLYDRGTVSTFSVDRFDSLYRANVRAAYLLTQSLLPLLIASNGEIVFINSSQGINASGGTGQFAATQHALRAIADSLRHEVNADGVRVLSLYPGRTATPRMQGIHKIEGKEYQPDLLLQPADVAAAVVSALALPRTAEVTDIFIRPRVKV